MARSHSSLPRTPLFEKLRYNWGLLRDATTGGGEAYNYSGLFDQADGVIARYREFALSPKAKPRIVEIGFGQKPSLLFCLASLGHNIKGLDLDLPMLHGTPGEAWRIARKNGIERAAKTWARYWLADRRHWRQVAQQFRVRYDKPFRRDRGNLFDGNAAAPSLWQDLGQQIDYIYSHDVFEHIPKDELPAVITNMAQALSPDGLVIIEPHIFTGIAGGHDLEWREDRVDQDTRRRREPWEHLRQDRFPADTFLNRLRRQDYRDLFTAHFEIKTEEDLSPGLGRRHLTPAIRQELSAYSDEDLFSNRVRFVLKKR